MSFDILIRLVIAAAIFIPLEHLLPRRSKAVLRPGWKTDALFATVSHVFIILGALGVVILGMALLNPFISEGTKAAIAGQHVILQVVEIMVLSDLVYYWIHRLFHTVPFMWRFHAVHHSIETLDWLAAHRVHPVDQVLTTSLSMVLPLALGFSAPALAVFAFIRGWHSLLKHSNVNITFGPLRWLYVSPTFHHWHHANERHAFDKNFAGQLPFLDLLFGTAIMEEKTGPKVYGTDTPVPEGFVDQLFSPFRRQPDAPVTEAVANAQ